MDMSFPGHAFLFNILCICLKNMRPFGTYQDIWLILSFHVIVYYLEIHLIVILDNIVDDNRTPVKLVHLIDSHTHKRDDGRGLIYILRCCN